MLIELLCHGLVVMKLSCVINLCCDLVVFVKCVLFFIIMYLFGIVSVVRPCVMLFVSCYCVVA